MMSENSDMSSLNGESEERSREDSFPEEYSCWEDFEYIETFLPRNIDF